MGVSAIVVSHHIKQGRINPPTHRVILEGRQLPNRYYTAEEAQGIVNWYRAFRRLPENVNKGRRKST